ncbi:DUF2236 domain-containing protein [Streptacidiphilus sp. PB12-B1b]|uniref:oxygenase MpaB family protein n=1 Tax=Streptacidiphilus sp. PB12-B1b TaxID=2705012 RepID=UPI0015F86A25|nr:oxygenase MpaB family protein [Streptacidiphilus sp. PB12-B1b]QMU76173.1 DUF2236 domain-containing protein [Streptacidiphilus sp. PB12-B1b]
MAGGVRSRIRRRVNATVHGDGIDLSRYDHPPGDRGLFGPDSVVWRVHGDLPGMVTGGIAALLLQSLHPLAIAGVDQHSDFRSDPLGRLHRTAGFVSVTSFGSTEAAESALARVRRIHTVVRGTAPDGRRYAADDPELLRWVHVAESCCFLAGHQRYGRAPLTSAQCDDYLREAAVVAERLGATRVPGSLAEVRAYLAAVRPELVRSEAAAEAVRFLHGFTGAGGDPAERAAIRLLTNGAADLLPAWAAGMLGVRRPAPVQLLLDRPAVRLLGAAIRYGCEPSAITATAAARVRARPAS